MSETPAIYDRVMELTYRYGVQLASGFDGDEFRVVCDEVSFVGKNPYKVLRALEHCLAHQKEAAALIDQMIGELEGGGKVEEPAPPLAWWQRLFGRWLGG